MRIFFWISKKSEKRQERIGKTFRENELASWLDEKYRRRRSALSDRQVV